MMNPKVVSNLEELSSIIGTFQGVSEAAQDERFIGDILAAAQERTLDKFNIAAAERSARVKNLNRNFNHMYEFGVAGITPGQTVIADPTSQAARLWVFNTVPQGRSVETLVTFRDAVVPNPKPADRRDLKKFKVSSEIISRMSTRKYVFKKRAEMTEYGRDVKIFPTQAKALIFPSRENESGVGFWPRSAGVMKVSLDGQTGHGRSKHKLAFTNYFLAWWAAGAPDSIRQSAHQSIAARIGAARRKAEKEAKKAPKPTTNAQLEAAAKKAQKKAKQEMMKGGNEV